MISPRLAAMLAAVVGALIVALGAWLIIGSPGTVDGPEAYAPRTPAGDAVEVTVEDGDSPSDIADKLETSGAIESGTQFRVLVQLMGYDRLLQAGTYELARGSTALEVIFRMKEGIVSQRAVTVIEGWQLGEIADAVAELGIPREDFIAATQDHLYDFTFVHVIQEGESLEGYLYPATYSLRGTDTGRDVVIEMLSGFAENVPVDEVTAQAAEVGLSLHEVLTIASVIEREAVVPEERPIMAQVFLSRLFQEDQPMEADPTVQYALAQDPANVAQFGYWKQRLTTDDLAHDSPYNTYVYGGLPPGPICSPSLASINAVLNPSDTEFLYFVARDDGSHAFAETFDEHQQNVAEIQGGG
ncbi:MAG TPA: endolytic transglycosylase MltG [Dehalococcoidia bacterium]|nr:endolytic transglycosylase MltG [Dehalococcoidia bacterium]